MYGSLVSYYSLCVFFVIISCLSLNKIRLNKIEVIVLSIFLIVVIVFRSTEMPDYYNYLMYFNSSDSNQYFKYREPTKEFFKYISSEFWFFLFIYASIAVSVKMLYIYKYYNSSLLYILSYVVFFFVLHEMIQIRLAAAVSILLFCFPAARDKKFLKFLSIISIATLFHATALLFIIVYFYRRRVPWLFLFICIFLSFLLSSFLGDLVYSFISLLNIDILSFYSRRYESAGEFKIINISTLSCFLIFVILFLNKSSFKKNSLDVMYAQSVAVGLVLFPIFSVFSGAVSYRILEFFSVTIVFLLPLFFDFFPKIKFFGRLLFFFFCLFYIFLSFNTLWLRMKFESII